MCPSMWCGHKYQKLFFLAESLQRRSHLSVCGHREGRGDEGGGRVLLSDPRVWTAWAWGVEERRPEENRVEEDDTGDVKWWDGSRTGGRGREALSESKGREEIVCKFDTLKRNWATGSEENGADDTSQKEKTDMQANLGAGPCLYDHFLQCHFKSCCSG